MPENNSTDLPLIDLSLVTFNSGKWIEAFFISLKSQSYPVERINVLVRDNGSTDDTLERISQAQGGGFNSFDVVRGDNVGFGEGHNANLARGNAEFFLVSNLDLTFEPEAISRIVRQACEDGENVASWEFRQKPFEHPKYYHPVTLETSWSSHACVLLRRRALEIAGGYEPRIFMYGEDVELSYRLRAHGFVLKYCPTAVCWHHTYVSANEVKPLQFLGSTLANSYLRLRYGSLPEILAIVPLQLALLAIPERFSGQRLGVLKNLAKLLKNAAYFLATRARDRQHYPFNRFDYERVRLGAFYENRPMPMSAPLFSVIMRTYRGRLGFLKQAIASVVNQTYPNIELIVVEDGSCEAAEYVAEIASRKVLSAIVHHPIEKGGRSRAGNAGLAMARGDYLCFLDDDDLFFADHLEVLLAEALANPSMGAVYSAAWQVKTRVLSLSPLAYQESAFDLIHQQPFSRPLLLQGNFIPIQAIAFKKELYRKFGGFNESIDYLEDWELWVRYASDSDFLFIPKITSLYRVPEKSIQAMARHRQFADNDMLVYEAMDKITITTTVGELRQFAQIMADRNYSLKISRNTLKKIFLKLPLSFLIYDLVLKLVRRR